MNANNIHRGKQLFTSLVPGALLAGLLAAGCGGSPGGDRCTPGESVACVGAGGCQGGQTCGNDGSTFGACDCAGTTGASLGDAGGGGAMGGGLRTDSGGGLASDSGTDADTGGAVQTICPPCWASTTCLADYPSQEILVSFTGSIDAHGNCAFAQNAPDGGLLPPAIVLGCGGGTSQGGAWTNAAVQGLGVQLVFSVAGQLYANDGSIVTDASLNCGGS